MCATLSIFKQLIKSLYSPKEIALYRFQGIGKTILFVFILSLLSVIPTYIYLQSAITNGVSAAKETIDSGFPAFTIDNGNLESDLKAPLTLNNDGFAIIFDSTGEVEKNDLQNIDNGIAFIKNDIVFIAGGQLQAYSYSMMDNLVLTKDDLVNLVDSFDSILVIMLPILFIVIYLFYSAIKFVEISILALLGILLKNVSSRKLQYRHLWRMSAYSVTLPTLFFTIMEALKTPVPASILIHWMVSLIVLFLAIKETPASK